MSQKTRICTFYPEKPLCSRGCDEICGARIEATNRVDHPQHYNQHPSGVECITVVEHMGFNLGNAVKYVWRADLKANAIEDLKKARWYIDREIQKRENSA
jgi:Protein of unknwon function (DUF3310)